MKRSCFPALAKMAKSVRTVRPFVEEFLLRDGRAIHVLGEGRLINLAAAEGHPVREVIIATNPSPEGDVTLLYLQERLSTKVPSITSMARGLPFGADLQYADAVTILRSLEERRGVE